MQVPLVGQGLRAHVDKKGEGIWKRDDVSLQRSNHREFLGRETE